MWQKEKKSGGCWILWCAVCHRLPLLFALPSKKRAGWGSFSSFLLCYCWGSLGSRQGWKIMKIFFFRILKASPYKAITRPTPTLQVYELYLTIFYHKIKYRPRKFRFKKSEFSVWLWKLERCHCYKKYCVLPFCLNMYCVCFSILGVKCVIINPIVCLQKQT